MACTMDIAKITAGQLYRYYMRQVLKFVGDRAPQLLCLPGDTFSHSSHGGDHLLMLPLKFQRPGR